MEPGYHPGRVVVMTGATTNTDSGTPGQPRWTGEGPPPATIIGASPGDTYLDTLTGDLYRLE